LQKKNGFDLEKTKEFWLEVKDAIEPIIINIDLGSPIVKIIRH